MVMKQLEEKADVELLSKKMDVSDFDARLAHVQTLIDNWNAQHEVLQVVAVYCCSALQCGVAVCCCSGLQWVAVGCSGLQWVAVGCSGLQSVAMWYVILMRGSCTCSLLQSVAV